MIEEIKRRLEAGEVVELECVDRIGFLKDIDISEANEEILDQGALIVDYIDHNGGIMLVGEIDGIYLNVIVSEEFKYFRIKQALTFDDLIDAVVQAKKDNIVSRVEINGNSLNATVNLTGSKMAKFRISKDAGGIVFKERIDWINSLYTETFVIENECDISRVKTGADIELANGNKCTFLNNDGMWRIKDDKGFSHNCGLLVLKGATVTQKRGK